MTYYFDHNATTPLSDAVWVCVSRVLRECYGNPSSIHTAGQAARQEVERARSYVAALLNADPREIVFTSGGTESDNLAVLGAVRPGGAAGKHVITTAIEHPAVLGACAQLVREGAEVTFLKVSGNGVVDPDEVRRALRPSTVLISVMHANNETGAIQPVEEISAIARGAGVCFHSDGVQAAGRLDTDVQALGVDLYSLSAHKLNAPKGAGALFVRKGVKLQALQFGGRHEQERRAGTENVPGIAALGCAAEQLQKHRAADSLRLAALRDRLESSIQERVPGVKANCSGAARSPILPACDSTGSKARRWSSPLILRASPCRPARLVPLEPWNPLTFCSRWGSRPPRRARAFASRSGRATTRPRSMRSPTPSPPRSHGCESSLRCTNMRELKRDAFIAVAMSGGVDSSTVAAMLKRDGYRLAGMTMQLWNQRRLPALAPESPTGRCCSLDDVYDARAVAGLFGIPYYVVNFEQAFEESVVKPFIDEYLAGRTPIPCTLCNNHVKFDRFLEMAEGVGADYIATGHYARVGYNEASGRWETAQGCGRG
jgi:cysteine desulfurase